MTRSIEATRCRRLLTLRVDEPIHSRARATSTGSLHGAPANRDPTGAANRQRRRSAERRIRFDDASAAVARDPPARTPDGFCPAAFTLVRRIDPDSSDITQGYRRALEHSDSVRRAGQGNIHHAIGRAFDSNARTGGESCRVRGGHQVLEGRIHRDSAVLLWRRAGQCAAV